MNCNLVLSSYSVAFTPQTPPCGSATGACTGTFPPQVLTGHSPVPGKSTFVKTTLNVTASPNRMISLDFADQPCLQFNYKNIYVCLTVALRNLVESLPEGVKLIITAMQD